MLVARKRDELQVGEGLKQAAGRDEGITGPRDSLFLSLYPPEIFFRQLGVPASAAHLEL